jgi:RNA polymerase sigma factor (sigma-70 family)
MASLKSTSGLLIFSRPTNMSERKPSSTFPAAGAQFPPTLWSVVLAAGQESSTRAEEALAALCRTYWYPLYAFVRRQGRNAHDAEDLTQGFFLHLFQNRGLEKVRRERGRFRSFLLTSLKNFLADEWEKASARKRGGGIPAISLDAEDAEQRYRAESMEQPDPEKLFERRWAIALLDRVLARLEAEQVSAGKQERFEQLSMFLSGDPQDVTYAAVAARLGMTEGAVKVAVLRLRQRYRELFRAEIANTVAGANEVDDEMRHLLVVLA